MPNVNNVLQFVGIIGTPAIISGIVIWWLARKMAALDGKGDARRKENVLILRGLLTIGGLASATARAVKDGQANGDVTEALDDYSEYRESLCSFLVEQTAQKNK